MTAPRDNTIRSSFDRANPNTVPDLLRLIAVGSLLAGQIPQVRRKVNMDAAGVSPYNLATLDSLVLPSHAKASAIVRATVRAGGVTGELTPVAFGVTPATTEIAVAPNGSIVTLGTDAITDLDLVYLPERADVVESVFPVATHVITLPDALVARGIVLLTEVEALEGTLTGRFVVLVPGAGAPASGQARLNLAKSTITFAAADVVTRARVKLAVVAAEDLVAVLDSPSDLI